MNAPRPRTPGIGVAALFVSLVLVPVAAGWSGDFKDAVWGMTPKEVFASAKEELQRYEGSSYSLLVTDTFRFSGMKCYTLYYFSHRNRLVKAGYFFRPGFREGSRYLEKYRELADGLADEFGDGTELYLWKTDRVYSTDAYGDAIENGHLSIVREWKLPRTDVQLLLGYDEYGYVLVLQCFSRSDYAEYLESATRSGRARLAFE